MERLGEAKEPSKRRKTTPEVEEIDRLAEKDDVRSSIPSRMKRQAILEVNTVGSLKVKRRTIIHTGQSSCQLAREVNTEDEAQDVFHITIQEGEEDESLEEDVIAAPSQLEDGGQATVDDLKELNLGTNDLPDEEVFCIDIFPTWTMFFDGSTRADGAGTGVVFMSPQRQVLPYSFQLSELCSNNVVEYQALILGLQMAINMEIAALEIYSDSKLIINQLLTEYEVRKDDLIPYFRLATRLLQRFEAVTLEHVPRKENQMADALANLASSMTLGEDEATNVPVCQRWVIPLVTEIVLSDTNVTSILPVNVEEWRQPLINYLEHGMLPDDPKRRSEVRRRAYRFLYYKGTLYRRSFEGVLLRCLGEEEANQAMEEAHSGICGAHQSGPKLHFQLKRMGYYWPSMVKDCLEYAKRCQACQFHANFIHQPPEPLHPTATSWPFDAWGLDVVGPIAPKSSTGEAYILAATDYFSKWAEAIPLKEVKKETVVCFIKGHIIHRYGVPRYIVTDNGKHPKPVQPRPSSLSPYLIPPGPALSVHTTTDSVRSAAAAAAAVDDELAEKQRQQIQQKRRRPSLRLRR
ncbi:uncharacterized protein [Malus domestica]|uniref:uncharacterized protein n=1 Tax=Malus domestica TaxID=3750 RepID=UPI0039770A7E